MKKRFIASVIIALLLIVFSSVQAQKYSRLPAEEAGEIIEPSGKIAFIRDGNLWMMNWDGSDQTKVVAAENAAGKLSWAPDGETIAFCRWGQISLKAPDNLGGSHKVYDIFLGYEDSAGVNTNWWRRLTDELGSRYPEFTPDGSQIIFTKDLNANKVNAVMPNYQTCIMDNLGGSFEVFRRDWQTTNYMSLMPTLGPNNMHAFVLMQETQQIGVAIAPLELTSISEPDLGKKIKLISGATAPAWSPDGKWIAYIIKDINNQAIYITDAEVTQRYLVFKPGIGQNLQTYPLSWSPNSKWLTFALGDGSLWVVDITGGGLRQITGPGMNEAPAWSR